MIREEFIKNALNLTKQREGILNSVQDEYIEAIIEGVIDEMEGQHGIKVDNDMLMFVVDYSSYRYTNRDSIEGMPLHLVSRLRNLYINKKNDNTKVGDEE